MRGVQPIVIVCKWTCSSLDQYAPQGNLLSISEMAGTDGYQTRCLLYDAENRLTSVSGAATATFVYDGDGNRVKATFGSTVRKYYFANGVRIAMRSGGQTYYLLGDHLGGTNVTANGSGVQMASLLYKPWGETRLSTGTTPTTWRIASR